MSSRGAIPAKEQNIDPLRIRSAWQGRISGCQLGKPVELLSMAGGLEALTDYLERAEAMPPRDYIPLLENSGPARFAPLSCRGHITRSEPDDDITYTVLALLMLEEHGANLETKDVGRAWLRYLPPAATFTAERAAYRTLLSKADEHFPLGAEPGFDLGECSDNPYSDWIGAQIRADLYGWVCPGKPGLAAALVRQDAALSHRGEGVYGAIFVAALAAMIPMSRDLNAAIETALLEIPENSSVSEAVHFGSGLVGDPNAVARLHERYGELSPVHTINNLALVVWGLLSGKSDFSVAIGDVVAAGWDTDCNGATVGGLWGLQGKSIPEKWTRPWRGRVAISLAGMGELELDELAERTLAVAEALAATSS